MVETDHQTIKQLWLEYIKTIIYWNDTRTP